jgi:hypothetical protein
VPKIEVPWRQDGDVSFVPTRVKWIESLGSKPKAKSQNADVKKKTKEQGENIEK